jgi:hypothetical protein
MTNKKNRIFVYDKNWQVPVRTEMYAYESLVKERSSLDFEYLAFPWATLIDALDTFSVPLATELLKQLASFKESRESKGSRLVSVCQHIKCLKYIDIIKNCGVTDLFWSHKVNDLHKVKGITLYPFGLFPAQTFNLTEVERKAPPMIERQYLTNFIGAFGAGYYLSDVRPRIFEDIGKYEDIKIIERTGWHFGRHVYDAQMKGLSPEEQQIKNESDNKTEYLDLMKNSKFTLCPSGSGPNSIRIFESIQLDSIPVILTRDLHLPGELSLWEAACVIVDDSRAGYKKAIEILRSMDDESIEKKRKNLQTLKKIVLPGNYADYIAITVL